MSRRGVSQLFTGFWVVGLYYFISVSIRLYLAIWKRIINSLFLAIVNFIRKYVSLRNLTMMLSNIHLGYSKHRRFRKQSSMIVNNVDMLHCFCRM